MINSKLTRITFRVPELNDEGRSFYDGEDLEFLVTREGIELEVSSINLGDDNSVQFFTTRANDSIITIWGDRFVGGVNLKWEF